MNWKYSVQRMRAVPPLFRAKLTPCQAKLHLAGFRYPSSPVPAFKPHHQSTHRHALHSGKRACEHSTKPAEAGPVTRREFWASRATWNRAALNTLRCLVGCTAGDFSAMWTLQTYTPDLGMGTIMGIASKYPSLSSLVCFKLLMLVVFNSGLWDINVHGFGNGASSCWT
jgi:hypothetical protein